MAGAQFGRDCSEAYRHVRKGRFAERRLQPTAQPAAADEPRAAQGEIEIAEHAAPRQLAALRLEVGVMTGPI